MALVIGSPQGQAVTLFEYEASWKLWRGKRPPTKPDYLEWTKVTYDASEWEIVDTPVFFGEKVETGTELTDMKNKYNSFFLRRKFDCPNPEDAIEVKQKLRSLGYPSIEDENGLVSKAKSFVSCATGKMSK